MTNYEYLVEAVSAVTDDCVLWPYGKCRDGYGKLKIDGKNLRAHRVALEHATPRPMGKVCSVKGDWVDGHRLYAAHGPCHNPACFNPRHLSWSTSAENTADRRRDGTNNDNENHPLCKLSDADIDRIRDLYKGPPHSRRPKTGPTQCELAARFGCDKAHIGNIINNKRRSVA